MRDNSGNIIDPSGQLITFDKNDISNNIHPSYNLFNDDDNHDNDPLHEWRKHALQNIIKLLEEDENSNGSEKRSRSTNSINTIMYPRK